MVKSETRTEIITTETTGAVVPATPGHPGTPERQERRSPGQDIGGGSSFLYAPSRSDLIPNHQDVGLAIPTGTPRRHDGPITQVIEQDSETPVVTNEATGTDGTSGEGSRRRRVRPRPARTSGGPTPPREPGMAGSEPPPPGETDTEAAGESREERVERVYRAKKAKLARWQETHVGQPNLLDLTEEAAEGLIPKQLLALVPNPEEVRVRLRRDPQKQSIDRDPHSLTLEFAFVIPSSTPVNDMTVFTEALEAQETQTRDLKSRLPIGVAEPQRISAGVDPMHWAMPGMVTSGTVEMTDIPIAVGKLQKIGSNDDADIFIDDWRVRENLDGVDLKWQGITTGFNRELEDFGRKQNFKYIVQHNEPRPELGSEVSEHDIAVYAVGRSPYSEDLPETVKTRFRTRNYLEAPSDTERLTFVDLSQQREPVKIYDAAPATEHERVFARFQEQIDEIQAAIDQGLSEIPHEVGTSSTGSRICWLEDPTDTRPPLERDSILTYFEPRSGTQTEGELALLRKQEQGRREALEIAASIPDPAVRENLEQMITYNETTGQVITRVPRAPHIDILPAEARRAVTMDNLRSALHTIETMVKNGIAPTSLNTSRLLDTLTGRILFKDFLLLNDSDLKGDSPSQSVARIFGSLTRQFTANPRNIDAITLAGENFPKYGAGILRDHFLYETPRLATATEVTPRNQIEAVYEYALSYASQSLTRDTLEASRIHDLALSRDGNTVEERLSLLRQAENAYDEIVYEQTVDGRRIPKTDQFDLWTDQRILQTRLALAFMPISAIRIQEGELTTEARTTLNHNLAEVLKDMLPSNINNVSQRAQGRFYGSVSEVVGSTLLSRQNVATSIAIPTSEVRRIFEGPDASLLFSDERGNHEFDIDWKLEHQGSAGDVTVGRIALSILNEMPEARQVLGVDNPTNRDAILFVARLLRDEGLSNEEGGRDLTPMETEYLNRVQARVWERIKATAEGGNGITDLENKARY